MTPKEVVDKYLGIPYKHKGRTMEALDCYGLAVLIYRDLGYELFDIDDYEVDWSAKQRNHILLNYHKQWVKVEKPALWDGVLIKTKHGASHGGLMLNSKDFIHCCRHGVVVSSLTDPEWKDRIAGFYHLRARDDSG